MDRFLSCHYYFCDEKLQSKTQLKMNKNKKIHITGSVGSGKTTLAKKLSTELDIPYYEIDNIIFERHGTGDIRRSEKEIVNILDEIVSDDAWILEGTSTKEWVIRSFAAADCIILLDVPYLVRLKRIIFRYLKQIVKLESANYNPSFSMLIQMFKWNHKFDRINKIDFYKLTRNYLDKVIVYTRN